MFLILINLKLMNRNDLFWKIKPEMKRLILKRKSQRKPFFLIYCTTRTLLMAYYLLSNCWSVVTLKGKTKNKKQILVSTFCTRSWPTWTIFLTGRSRKIFDLRLKKYSFKTFIYYPTAVFELWKEKQILKQSRSKAKNVILYPKYPLFCPTSWYVQI